MKYDIVDPSSEKEMDDMLMNPALCVDERLSMQFSFSGNGKKNT